MDSIAKKLGIIDSLIKEAKWKEAQLELSQFRKGKALPRPHVLPFAQLCRRASIPELGLTALRPFVCPTGRQLGKAASEAERTEYATILIRIGLCNEARNLLSNATTKSSTEVVHTLAYLNSKRWNYPAATKYFLEYTSRSELDSYALQIGRLNLAMSLTFEEKLDHAEDVIQSVLNSKEAKSFDLVKANALRLFGVIAFHKGDHKEAIRLLKLSSDAFPESNSIDLFLNEKWTAIVNYCVSRASNESREKIEAVRKKAVQLTHWESVRDIEYHTAAFDGDENKLIYLYYGTPYEHFRNRITRKFPNLKIPKSLVWRPSGNSNLAKHVFDITQCNLKVGHASHRLLSILSSDFYRPFSTVDVFDHVFSEENYLPGSSESRAYQIISRTRLWLKAEKIPLEIVSIGNGVRLMEKDCAVVVQENSTGEEQDYYRLEMIRFKLGDSFSVSEAVPLFDVSRRTVISLITNAVNEGVLIRTGKGKNTRYTFAEASNASKKAA